VQAVATEDAPPVENGGEILEEIRAVAPMDVEVPEARAPHVRSARPGNFPHRF